MSTLLNISDKIGLQSTPNPSLLNLYGGAAAAYSLRQLDYNYTGPAVTVRRDSDQATKDIGFVNGELDTASLEAFTTEDYVRISSDYSGATPDPSAATNSLTVESNQSALGVSEALKCTVTGSSPYFYLSGFGGSGIELNISFDYYIPSGQSLGSIRVGVASPEETFSTTGEWATANFNQTSSYSFVIFRANTNVIGDEFYVKNLVVTQTSANGFVTTWYDQSGNGNDATQGTASAQPKIVSLGSTILENGKATLEFDGTRVFNSSINLTAEQSAIAVATKSTSQAYLTSDDLNHHAIVSGFINGFESFDGPRFTITSNPTNTIGIVSQFISSTFASFYNQTANATGTTTYTSATTIKTIGGYEISGFRYNGKISELVLYSSDERTNQSGIYTNINDFYSIY